MTGRELINALQKISEYELDNLQVGWEDRDHGVFFVREVKVELDDDATELNDDTATYFIKLSRV